MFDVGLFYFYCATSELHEVAMSIHLPIESSRSTVYVYISTQTYILVFIWNKYAYCASTNLPFAYSWVLLMTVVLLYFLIFGHADDNLPF